MRFLPQMGGEMTSANRIDIHYGGMVRILMLVQW